MFCVLSIICNVFFDVFCVIWNPVFADEATAVFGYEQIVFDADSAKIFILVEFVEVEEFGAMFLCPPFVD